VTKREEKHQNGVVEGKRKLALEKEISGGLGEVRVKRVSVSFASLVETITLRVGKERDLTYSKEGGNCLQKTFTSRRGGARERWREGKIGFRRGGVCQIPFSRGKRAEKKG